jgi:organic radical activating enzyme
MNFYRNGNHTVKVFRDGTKIKETINPDDQYFVHEFAENCDIKITDYCDAGCAYCHEGSSINGKAADILSMKNIWDSLIPGTEMAIGGGNALSHPDLVQWLKILKGRGVFANITVNQKHVESNKDLIKHLIDNNLIHGIGISLTDSKTFPSKIIDSFGDNVVVHTIAGILTEDDFDVLRNRKVLILGYKMLRRGESFFSPIVDSNIKWLADNLTKMAKIASVLSFDCLAIEQLNPQKNLNISIEDWNQYFQGDDNDVFDNDGNIKCSTFYIDAVEKTVARTSTTPFEKRKPIEDNDDIISLFKKSCSQ